MTVRFKKFFFCLWFLFVLLLWVRIYSEPVSNGMVFGKVKVIDHSGEGFIYPDRQTCQPGYIFCRFVFKGLLWEQLSQDVLNLFLWFFHQMKVVDYRPDPHLGRCHDNQFWGNIFWPTVIHKLWHFKTELNIAFYRLVAPIIPLHHVQIS